MQFRNDIQGLRAIAFFLVFIFHLNKNWLPGGFLGVDLFFVISGYLVSSIILHDISLNRFQFSAFFVKRMKRIIPAYFFMLFIVAFASLYIYMYLDVGTIKGTLLRCAFFMSNLIYANGENYFGALLSENPLVHTWSLAIEMQFYFILPLVLFYFNKKLQWVILSSIVLLTLYSHVQIFHYDHQNQMYFSLLARIPQFFVGVLMAVLFKNGLNLPQIWNTILALLCTFIFFGCTFFITEETPYPGFIGLIPAFAAGFLLVSKNNFILTFLSQKWLVHFGKLSYSLYLFHWPIMAMIRYRFDEYSFDISTLVIISLLTYLFSWISYTFVEEKFRKQETNLFIKIIIPTFVGFIIFCSLMPAMAKHNEIPPKYSSPVVGIKSHNVNKSEKLGNLSKNDSIILIGDSHAFSLKPFLDEIGRKNHFSFYTLTRNIYPALLGIKKEEIPKEKIQQIIDTDSLVVTTQKLIHENEIIILMSIGFDRLPSLSKSVDSLAAHLRPSQKLILLSTFPVLNKNPLKLNNGFVKKNNYHFIHTENSESTALLNNLAKKYPNVFVYNIAKSKIFKNAPYVNDTVAYFDALHLNQYGALKLEEDIGKDFAKFLYEIRKK